MQSCPLPSLLPTRGRGRTQFLLTQQNLSGLKLKTRPLSAAFLFQALKRFPHLRSGLSHCSSSKNKLTSLGWGLQVKPQPSNLLHLFKPRFTVEVPLLGTKGQGKRKTAALFLPFSQAHGLSFVFCPEEGGWRGRRKNKPENTIL